MSDCIILVEYYHYNLNIFVIFISGFDISGSFLQGSLEEFSFMIE